MFANPPKNMNTSAPQLTRVRLEHLLRDGILQNLQLPNSFQIGFNSNQRRRELPPRLLSSNLSRVVRTGLPENASTSRSYPQFSTRRDVYRQTGLCPAKR